MELKQRMQNCKEFLTYKRSKLEQGLANMKMLDRFEEDDDVQNVYHNMEMTEEA
jgi:transcriptional/translational regulatory protein YebC/TACO1